MTSNYKYEFSYAIVTVKNAVWSSFVVTLYCIVLSIIIGLINVGKIVGYICKRVLWR